MNRVMYTALDESRVRVFRTSYTEPQLRHLLRCCVLSSLRDKHSLFILSMYNTLYTLHIVSYIHTYTYISHFTLLYYISVLHPSIRLSSHRQSLINHYHHVDKKHSKQSAMGFPFGDFVLDDRLQKIIAILPFEGEQ